jgi:hypothetical protein
MAAAEGTTRVRYALFTGALLVLCSSTLATRPSGATVPPYHVVQATPRPTPAPFDQASLYSRRSRRLVQSYLRLKLWQLREQDLERARRVIERKLGIGALLGETPAPNAR